MAKKKTKLAKKASAKKGPAKKKPAAKKAAAKRAVKRSKPAKKASRKKSAPKTKRTPVKKPVRKPQPQTLANHVRIDRVTQGPDGQETPADRLSIRYDDFLWIYVEAELPGGAAPQGEYAKVAGGMSASPQRLDPPTLVGGMFRFSVIHYSLSPGSTYQFRFADNLATPTYQDQWEIVTVPL